MSEEQSAEYTPGRFVWHELFSRDVEKSKRFYSSLFGWSIEAIPMGPMTYHLAKKGEQGVAGIMPVDVMGRPGLPSFWLGYVSVPSVDEAAKACAANGGLVAMPPNDIPNLGRFALFGDPAHGYSAAWRSLGGDGNVLDRPPVGTFCWDQINVPDPERVATFYQKVYGWTRDAFPGSNDMWVYSAGGRQVASMMKSPPGPPAHWLAYVLVDSLDDARARTETLGGRIMVPKVSIPNVGDISVIADDVGAMIGLFEAPR